MVIYMELLANTLRPSCLDDVVGQRHLVGENKIIRNLVNNKHIFSMILYGPPGTGKTTLAYAIVNELGVKYRMLNAVINNKSDFDVAIEEAKMYGSLVLIVDEIHRMNKDKQDILLPYLENGLITLIGLTTSNPYFKINPAIRSRVQIFELKPVSKEDIVICLKRACKKLDKINVNDEALEYIASLSNGDVRASLSLLEVAYYSTKDGKITIDLIQNINPKVILDGDQDGDAHYDLISALQKSVRGSDVDAALYYLGRLIVIGDLDIIYRRLSVIAYEDIGLANPGIGPKVMAAIEAANLVGLPEARIPLGTIVTEMALSPKSNSAHVALDSAINDISNGINGRVPAWLKTNSKDYKYPHDYKNSWVDQQYLPTEIKNKKYFVPKNNKYEMNLVNIHKEMKK